MHQILLQVLPPWFNRMSRFKNGPTLQKGRDHRVIVALFSSAIALMIPSALCAQTPNFNGFQTFEGGTNGATVSSAALNSGQVCNAAGVNWSLQGNASTQMHFSSAASAPLPADIVACGTVQTPGGTLGVTYALNTGSTGYIQGSFSNNTGVASIGFWFKTDLPTSDTGYHSMGGISSGTGDFVSLMIQGGQFYLESGLNPNGNPDVGTKFLYTANKWYWVTEQYQRNVNSISMHSLSIYDCGTPVVPVLPCKVLSAQRKYSMNNTQNPNFLAIGKIGDNGTPASLVYYDSLIMDTTGQTFPIVPGSGSLPAPPTGLAAVIH
jgi:hypothetical protein